MGGSWHRNPRSATRRSRWQPVAAGAWRRSEGAEAEDEFLRDAGSDGESGGAALAYGVHRAGLLSSLFGLLAGLCGGVGVFWASRYLVDRVATGASVASPSRREWVLALLYAAMAISVFLSTVLTSRAVQSWFSGAA
jgi:hypothetical protein